MEAEARGFENNIHRWDFTANLIWSPSADNTFYKAKLTRVQWLINIRIAKAYRTVSNEVLRVITGLIPINIKIEESAKYYEIIKGHGHQFDREMEIKHWTYPANSVKITEGQEDSKHVIHIFTDGSKNRHRVGSGLAIFTDREKYRLDGQCSNNQAEQLAILKALENIQYLETNDRTVLISTDSRITLESLKTEKTTHTSSTKSG
jgi:hypothetical protein